MQRTSISSSTCGACKASGLQEFGGYAELARVTSDAKPWPAGGRLVVCDNCGLVQKPIDTAWSDEIDRVYSEYRIYHQAGGAEQQVFDAGAGTGTPRSAVLIRHLIDTLALPEIGSFLDFGCGTGVTLRNFSTARPSWTLYGSELSDATLSQLRQIPHFADLFTCSPENIPLRFNVITLIHALEHVLDPVQTLKDLGGRLEASGAMFIQVPNCSLNPYDLVIVDHRSHFTMGTLDFVAREAGFQPALLSNSIVQKELSLLVRSADTRDTLKSTSEKTKAPERSIDVASGHLDWLAKQVEAARAIAAASARFGIFGTSISGSWLGGILSDQIAFFVDEDPSRISRQHLGRPIISPDDIPLGADVFVPLIPDVARAVARRLARNNIRFHEPPSIN